MAMSNQALAALARRVIRAAVGADGEHPTRPDVGGTYIDHQTLDQMMRILPGDDVARKVRAFLSPPY